MRQAGRRRRAAGAAKGLRPAARRLRPRGPSHPRLVAHHLGGGAGAREARSAAGRARPARPGVDAGRYEGPWRLAA